MLKLDEYTLNQILGKGTFGEVYLTQKDNDLSNYYATKKMKKEMVEDRRYIKYFNNEISILRKLKHENIIRLENLKVTKNHYYIIMEYCNGGSLSQCLNRYKELYHHPFTEEIVQHIMRQIVDAVRYIHSQRIIHRDLKLDNILVQFLNRNDYDTVNLLKAKIKIIDFGFATYKDSGDMSRTAIGSPLNMDPLILKKFTYGRVEANDLYYDEKADIWSIGALCYQMLIGNSPFDAYNMKELVEKIEEGNYNVPTNLSMEVVSFLNGMLQYNPNKRLNAESLFNHAFLKNNVSEFSKINTNLISGKVYGGQLNINIKNNQSIWAIFNEENQKTFDNIPINYFPNRGPIGETESRYVPNTNNSPGITPEPFNEDQNFININFNKAKSIPINGNNQIKNYSSETTPPINERSYMTQNSGQNMDDEQYQSFSSKPNKIDNIGLSPQMMNNQVPKKESIMTVKDGLFLAEDIQINNGQYQNINQKFNMREQNSNNITGNFESMKSPIIKQTEPQYNNNINTPQQINNQVNYRNQYMVNQIPPLNIYPNPQNMHVIPQSLPITNPQNLQVAYPKNTPIIQQQQNQMNLRQPQYINNVSSNIMRPENIQIGQKKIYINPQRINSPPPPQYGVNQPGQIKIIKPNLIQSPNKLISQQKNYQNTTVPHNKPAYRQNHFQQISPIANKYIRRNVLTPLNTIRNINLKNQNKTPNKNPNVIKRIMPQMQQNNRQLQRIPSEGNLGPRNLYKPQNYPQQKNVVIKMPIRKVSNNQIAQTKFQNGVNKNNNYVIRTPQKQIIVQNPNILSSPHPNIIYKRNVV